jgi:hypothetical protein
MSDLIEPVGARLTLLNGPAFRAGLAAATDALQAFNDEQARAADLSDAAADSIAASQKAMAGSVVSSSDDMVVAQNETTAAIERLATLTDDAAASIIASQEAIAAAATTTAATVTAANVKTADSSVTAAAATKTAWTSAVATSTKILKYAGVIGAVVVYEGIKKYMSFQQQMTQLAISAGVSKSQLPAFTKMATDVSNATGMAAVSVGDMMYRIASANPKIKMTTQSMEDMVTQAGNLAVLTSTGSPNTVADTTARLYGAIVSNAMSLTRGGPALTYSTAGGKAINEWVLAAAGHGDITPAQLVAAMGTGLLPVAKTFGLSLNDVGAMLDVLTPAMGAQQASTRLKTAIGLLGAPSQKAYDAAELVGGNATTMGGLLRTGGPTALMNYLSALQTKAMSGASFIGGGIYGAASGKYTGVKGAADFLKSIGFTNAGLVSLLQTQGISGLKSMTSAQLQGLGFNAGMTGKQASATVMADIIGQMFGGGRTGAAIMQLLNERGTLANKQAAIAGAETPKAYGAALKLAFAEPIVTFHKFEQQLENLTIRVGKDVTPALDSFMNVLLKIGKWFGNNKWALETLGAAAGAIVAGAFIVKTISVVEKLGTGVINIGKYLLTGTTATGGASLTGAASALDASAASLQTAADMLMGRGGVGGVAPVGTAEGTEVGEAGDVGFGAMLLGGKTASAFVRASIGKVAIGALAEYLYHTQGASRVNKAIKSKPLARIVNDTAQGAIIGATVASILPGIGTVAGGLLGGGLGGLYGLVASSSRPTSPNVMVLAQMRQGVTTTHTQELGAQGALAAYHGTNFMVLDQLRNQARTALANERNAQGALVAYQRQFKTGTNAPQAAPPTTPFAANAAGTNFAVLHDLSSAAKKYAITADSLKTSSDDQKTAADKTNNSAETMQIAGEQMLLAAQQWLRGATTISTALSPGNIYNLSKAGARHSIAGK